MGCAASTPRVKPKPAATIAMATDAARRAARVRGARPSDALRTALPSPDVRAVKAELDELAARQRLAAAKSLADPGRGHVTPLRGTAEWRGIVLPLFRNSWCATLPWRARDGSSGSCRYRTVNGLQGPDGRVLVAGGGPSRERSAWAGRDSPGRAACAPVAKEGRRGCDSGHTDTGRKVAAGSELSSGGHRWPGQLRRLVLQVQLRAVLRNRHAHVAAARQAAEQQLLRQRPLDVLLDGARHRPGAHLRVVAFLCDPAPRGVVERDGDALLLELHLHFNDELVHHALDGDRIERCKLDDRIEAVAELGGEDEM